MATPKPILGGDDVHAIVADCGSSVVRIGNAGDDTPRCLVPSAVAIGFPPRGQERTGDVVMSESNCAPSSTGTHEPPQSSSYPNPVAGDIITSAPHLFQDVRPVYTHDYTTGDASVRSWDYMLAVWRAGFSTLSVAPEESPLLLVEPTRMWRDTDRAAALERAFEGLCVPAAYLARGSAMSAFSAGRTTACVIDVGTQGATAVSVLDGYALCKSTRRGVVGGAFLSEQTREWVESYLETRPGYDGQERPPGKRMRGDQGRKEQLLRAPHEIKRERIISGDKVRKYVVTDMTSDKYAEGHRLFYRLRVMDDLKASVMQLNSNKIADNEGKDAIKSSQQGGVPGVKNKNKNPSQSGDNSMKSDEKDEKEPSGKEKAKEKGSSNDRNHEYTLPDGNVLSLEEHGGTEIAEWLFNSSPSGADGKMRSLSELVLSSIGECDVDIRRDLFGGVVVVGGSTMIPGVVERLTRELAVQLPQAYKLKVHASTMSIERTCAAWVGGSIVATLGTFQQVWISKGEYDEQGAINCLRKCP